MTISLYLIVLEQITILNFILMLKKLFKFVASVNIMSGTVTRTVINTDRAPKAIGPYNQGIKVGNTLYLSGQIGLDPETMELVGSDVEAQAHQVFKNMSAVLDEAGLSFFNVVKTTVLLADINDFAKVNAVYQQYFQEPYPARAAFEVANLPKLARVEVEGIAIAGLQDALK